VRSHHIFMVAITALGGALLQVVLSAPPARGRGRPAGRARGKIRDVGPIKKFQQQQAAAQIDSDSRSR
jgi:hypothetical protein